MKEHATPLMKQYFAIKECYPDTLLFFQVGDFYELFFEDAKKASVFLGITLTSRGKNSSGHPIPLCGVPVHALDYYLAKLVRGGFHVAICDQLEAPKPGTVVKRGVTRVLTPGTLTDTNLLDEKSASYLLSFFPNQDGLGLLFAELLSAQLFATALSADAFRLVEGELVRFFPDEIVLPDDKQARQFIPFFSKLGFCTSINALNIANNEPETAWLSSHFSKDALRTISQQTAVRYALFNFYWYLKKNQHTAFDEFKHIHFYEPDDFLLLDAATQKNLELVKNSQDGKRSNTLFSLLDQAVTAMGSRCIKKWVVRPLLKKELIVQRQDLVEFFVSKPVVLQQVQELLRTIGDLERIIGRIALGRAQVHDYCLLTQALYVLPKLKEVLMDGLHYPLIHMFLSYCDSFITLHKLLHTALDDELGNDTLIKKGFDQKLDQIRELVSNSNQAILSLEKQEQEKTSINSLKIRYNQVHGYYVEITKPNLHLVPKEYIRSQTLVGKERFTTLELKKLEGEIAQAYAHMHEIEQELFERIKKEVDGYTAPLRKLAQILTHIDALASFGAIAHTHNYTRPLFNDANAIEINEGKHPVVAHKLEHQFIANDVCINDEQQLLIITGPNMGGKSTYLRQTALICIMAQCGSFVSAKKANLAILDRIFTRIGAGDNVADGKSTFLVDMEETAVICTQATQRSLVILDEVGRGTSTFDGLAIAQAVVEFIYTHVKARCLFATHYHELTQLSNQYSGIRCHYAASKKTDQGILLLYKILRGAADGSFGLEVAKIAQLPTSIIDRAHEVLENFTMRENKERTAEKIEEYEIKKLLQENQKLRERINDLCAKLKANDELASRLHSINLDELSPKKAFDILWEFKGD